MLPAILAEVTSTWKHFSHKDRKWKHGGGMGTAGDLKGKCEDHLLTNAPAYSRHWKLPKILVRVTSNSCTDLGGIPAKERMVQAELSSQTGSKHCLWQSCKLPLKQENVAWTRAAGSAQPASHGMERKSWALPPLQVSSLSETKAGTSFVGLGVTCRQVRWVRTMALLGWVWSSTVTPTAAPWSILLQEAQKVVHGLQPSRGVPGCSEHTNPLYLCYSNTIITKQGPKSSLVLRCHQCSELGWGSCWACFDTGISPRFCMLNACSLYTGPCLQSALVFSAGLALSTNHKTSEKFHIYSFQHITVPH